MGRTVFVFIQNRVIFHAYIHFKTLTLLFKSFHEIFWHNNLSAGINFLNNPLPPAPRKVTVARVHVCIHKFTCTNVIPKKKQRNGGHFTPLALGCARVTNPRKPVSRLWIGHLRVPLFQNEGRCPAFLMEIIFHSHANETHFRKKDCAPSLIWKWGFLELGSGLLHVIRRTRTLSSFPGGSVAW